MPVYIDMHRYCEQLKPGSQFAILYSLGTRLEANMRFISLAAFQAGLAEAVTAITGGGILVYLTGVLYYGIGYSLLPYYGVGMAGGLLSAIGLVSRRYIVVL